MKFPFLFSANYSIVLIDCHLDLDSRTITANISRLNEAEADRYSIKENAITTVCDILLPQWAISDEPLIFLEPVELEIVNVKSQAAF